MTTAIERLEELLNTKDEQIDELEARLAQAKVNVRGSAKGWSLPRIIADEHPNLPVPRLEIKWTPDKDQGWNRIIVEYRLVRRHFEGHLEVVPFGETTISGGGREPYYQLPGRDGARAHHDAAHLGLQLFLLLPDGPVLADPTLYQHAIGLGNKHRR